MFHTVKVQKWLCVSRGGKNTEDLSVWITEWTNTRPPFAIESVAQDTILVPKAACNDATPVPQPKESSDTKLLKDMTEPELGEHLTHQLRFIKSCQTPDTIGSMLIIFGEDGISQYGATIDPETAPAALRELADRIEKRQTVER